MNRFDVNTLKEIAALICGTDGDGPVYRQYWEIRNFFAAAGWTDVPPFESGRGYGRNRWTYDLLLERQDDPEAIAQVIRRLADRREYPKSPDMPFVVCELLNKVLAVEDPPRNRDGQLPVEEWKLSHLIDVAHKCRWIDLDVKRFSQELREYRNMVHTAGELKDGHHPDGYTFAICREVVVAALNDLSRISSPSAPAA
jgi:hypothetical protein